MSHKVPDPNYPQIRRFSTRKYADYMVSGSDRLPTRLSNGTKEMRMSDAGGPLWLFIDVLLVVVLAGALVYGMMMWRRWKNHPRAATARDQKTKELFRNEQ